MKYLLGIDFGGGSSKATLLTENGDIAATNSFEYETFYPGNGFAEQNPKDWIRAACENISGVIKKSGINPSSVECVCVDAATHTSVLMDENFNVLRPAIHWTDSRATEECAYLLNEYGDLIKNKSLHSPDTIWTLPQLLWVKKHESDIFAKTKRILFEKDYVRHMLTGDYVTDYIEAEGSMFFDCNTLTWSDELCDILGFDKNLLPKIVKPYDIAGKVTKDAAKKTGLCEGTPVICGTTDTVMEILAAGAVKEGNITVKLATAGRICVITNKPFADRDFVNYSHIVPGLWYPGTATKSCAASYRWFRDTFGGDYESLDKIAEEIDIGCGGLMFHPHLSGELTPYADPLLCGSFIGITGMHKKAHFARAVLEGVALSLVDCKNVLDKKGIKYDNEAVIIGGSSKSALWRQIVSDALGLRLKLKNVGGSSLGSAILAGVSCGVFKSFDEAIEKSTKESCVTVPNELNREKYDRLFKKYKAVHDALAPIYHGDML